MLLLRYFLSFGLASLTVALPAVTLSNAAEVYRTDTYIDEKGIEKRSTQVIDKDLHETLIYYSEYTSAAYCPIQTSGKVGVKVACAPTSKTCERVEKSDTKIYSSWIAVGNNSATGFVAADNTRKKIVLSLRGSVSLSNWIADIKFVQTACPKYGGPQAACSIGFLGFWQQCQPDAMKGIKAALAEHPDYPIVVTGHSLGGVAAVYAASDLRAAGYKGVEMYTYGQPRAGNEVMSKYATDLGQGLNFRVTHTSDAVPKLPPEGGPLGMLSGNYKHVSPEYWISDGVGMKVENIKVLEGLSNDNGNTGTGHLKFNIVAHVQYFQTNMYYCVLPLGDYFGYGPGTRRKVIDPTIDYPIDIVTGPKDPWNLEPGSYDPSLKPLPLY